MRCRSCETELEDIFIDLVNAPLSNSYLTTEELNQPEEYFPLKVFTCHKCFLTQVEEFKKATAIFDSTYSYFSSFSTSWLDHAQKYCAMIIKRLHLSDKSKITEIASNDGYLLKNFVEQNIPCLGVEPSKNTAEAAFKNYGIVSYTEFWGSEFARKFVIKEGYQNLIIGNNVLAHTPQISDFIHGLTIALAAEGTVTMEFPHILNLINQNQFDTIYHEHFSYLSLTSLIPLFQKHQLEIYDVEELTTHGGSLRIFVKHQNNNKLAITGNISTILKKEAESGLDNITTYKNFQNQADKVKYGLLNFLLKCQKERKKVAAYGAAAKGNTLLNYCGIKGTDLISFIVDASTYKQNKFLPGSHIPITIEENLTREKPDYIIIMPWNLKEEIAQQLAYSRKWSAKFVIAIPELTIF